MDYSDLKWEHLNKQRLLFGISSFTMWIRAINYPFGLVKTRMQAVAKSGQVVYDNTFHAFSSIVKCEGFRALYRGFWINSVAIVSSPLYMFTLESTRDVLIEANARRGWVEHSTMERRVSGCLGGIMASLLTQTLTVPLDNVTQRLMVQRVDRTGRPASALVIAEGVLQQAGLRGFYRGYGASLLAHAPGAAIFWGVYFPMKANLRVAVGLPPRSHSCWDPKELAVSVTAGATSACVTTLVTNPLDVVRTRMQLTDTRQAPTILGTMRSIAKTEGMSGLRRGMAPRMLSMTITTSLASGGYEVVKRLAVDKKEAKGLMLQVRG